MEALQIESRTTSIEWNTVAVEFECAKRAHWMLERNNAVKLQGAADRLLLLEGDILQIRLTLLQHQRACLFDHASLCTKTRRRRMPFVLGIYPVTEATSDKEL